ncbi:MAG TPA: hypothetical protein VK752_04160 [Bryobacteraceae bacterium]|jgi:hypothetical protein|nr:hypothetical protein [Bryobacteraceae bacterium]
MVQGLMRLIAVELLTAVGVYAQSKAANTDASNVPRFEDYPIVETFNGPPAKPILTTSEQQRYRTRILNGIAKGTDAWSGSWRNPIKSPGPNFAGHYFVIRWGCGSNCLMMAIVDAQNGSVHAPPLSGAGSHLYVPMDMMGDGEIDFRPNSSLMVLRNACASGRSECGVYYFNWSNNHFILLKRVLVDLTKVEAAK